MSHYDAGYYDELNRDACKMASRVVPMVVELLQPSSVLDVGCGQGAWLAEFLRRGVKEIHGLDGKWVDTQHLLIPGECFSSHDITMPWPLSRGFDLAVCLEVAEHLPETASGDLVHQLTQAAPSVLFSAAIPYQEGTHHVNCQWPAYWAEKFRQNGFMALDPFRLRLWADPDVVACYAQNMLLYVREDVDVPWSDDLLRFKVDTPLSLVHPKIYMKPASILSAMMDERILIRKNWKIFWASVVRRLGSLVRGGSASP
jgi:SAM-dependent methyltransferase